MWIDNKNSDNLENIYIRGDSMGIVKKSKVAVKLVKVGAKIAKEAGIDQMLEKANAEIEVLRDRLSKETNEDLMRYVPTVYQKSIYKIDYHKLKAAGIKLISFDIDDTISDSIKNKVLAKVGVKNFVSRDAEHLFEKLKFMGFTIVLFTNSGVFLAEPVCEQLKADGYIANANKPEIMNFEYMRQKYGVEKSQMAHVGNSMKQDVVGGNTFGITTCYVRRNGITMSLAKHTKADLLGIPTEGQVIRDELLKRGMFRRHHLNEKGDQYYQLNEEPFYKKVEENCIGK